MTARATSSLSIRVLANAYLFDDRCLFLSVVYILGVALTLRQALSEQ